MNHLRTTIIAALVGFIAGFAFKLLIDSWHSPYSCGDTMAGIGCALDLANKYLEYILLIGTIYLTVNTIGLMFFKIKHALSISIVGVVISIMFLYLPLTAPLFAFYVAGVFFLLEFFYNKILFKEKMK